MNIFARNLADDKPVLFDDVWLCTWHESETNEHFAEDFRGVSYCLGPCSSGALGKPVRTDRPARPINEMLVTYPESFDDNGDIQH